MQFLKQFVDFILHLDVHLTSITSMYGSVTYLLLFLIIFGETGFVVTPFLPGDSLLFAAGSIAQLGSLNFPLLLLVLFCAAVIGDTANYWIGHFFGQKMIENPHLPIKQEHIDKTQAFYAKYGGKTIILARFVPIVRTFAPFVAGIGTMDYKQFITFNMMGGAAWVFLVTSAGYFFGKIPMVKHNFSLVVLMIIVISIMPMVYEYVKAKRGEAR